MMRPCEQCLENNWNFRVIEGYVQATCNLCGYEVEFKAREKKPPRPKLKEFDPCPKCRLDFVVLKKLKMTWKKHNRLMSGKQPYFFTHALECRMCKAQFMIEEKKVSADEYRRQSTTYFFVV